MAEIRETDLPGIGHKVQLETDNGDKLVVVIHDDGKRQLFFFDAKDPEECVGVATFDDGEARRLAAIIGGMTYTPKALQSLDVGLDDLTIEWYKVPQDAKAAGKSIGELQMRQRTGASIIAIIQPDDEKRLNPGPEEVIRPGATLIVSGTRESVKSLERLIQQGS